MEKEDNPWKFVSHPGCTLVLKNCSTIRNDALRSKIINPFPWSQDFLTFLKNAEILQQGNLLSQKILVRSHVCGNV